uniref:TGF-beta family profile domain-containing protein n=1 Tax=Leptobrachium leishanense TaxID=445787 RepID=A0A8C5M3K8_9ANUR
MVAWIKIKAVYILFYGCLSISFKISDHLLENEVRSSGAQRKLKAQARHDIQREILSILGLQHRPRPNLIERKMSAPLFMMDLYNAMAVVEENEAGFSYADKPVSKFAIDDPLLASFQERNLLLNTNMVMSFVNLVENDIEIYEKWYRKEFKFDLNDIPQDEEIISAEFRLYKDLLEVNETFQINIFQVLALHPDKDQELLQLGSQVVCGFDKGWLTFDITASSIQWLFNPDSNLGLQVSVETLDEQGVDPRSIGIVGRNGSQDKQPFMVTFFKSSEVHLRSIRSTSNREWNEESTKTLEEPDNPLLPNLSETFLSSSIGSNRYVRQSCKRHELNVSFRHLGWHDWIIAPEGYSAYYCDGECAFPLNSHMNATNHAIVQTLIHFINPDTVPRPCCAPSELLDISVLFFDDHSNVILKKYKNMMVRSCGCQ